MRCEMWSDSMTPDTILRRCMIVVADHHDSAWAHHMLMLPYAVKLSKAWRRCQKGPQELSATILQQPPELLQAMDICVDVPDSSQRFHNLLQLCRRHGGHGDAHTISATSIRNSREPRPDGCSSFSVRSPLPDREDELLCELPRTDRWTTFCI